VLVHLTPLEDPAFAQQNFRSGGALQKRRSRFQFA
jgi:hypothetical protein